MKRALYLLLALACLFTALCGCEKDEPSLPTGADPIESYDNESRVVVEGSKAEDSSEHAPAEGDFVVKGKKYVYQMLDCIPAEEVVILTSPTKRLQTMK